MASPAGAVWLEVLPSLSKFGPMVMAGTRVPLAAAGTTAGGQYANGLVGAVRSGLGALGMTVGKQTGAAAAQAAQSVETAEAKIAQAKLRAQDAAGKVRVAEMKLQEVRSKEGATADQIARATANVAKAHAQASKAVGDVSVAEAKLEATQKGQSAQAQRVVAATEKLNLARQGEVAKIEAVNVASAKLDALREKEAQRAQKITDAENKESKAVADLGKARQDLARVQESTGSQASKIEANAKALREAEQNVAKAERDAAKASKELSAARKNGVNPSDLARGEEELAKAERGLKAASENAAKAADGLSRAQKDAGEKATTAKGRFGQFRTSVETGTDSMGRKLGGFAKSVAGMAGLFGGFQLTKFAGDSLHAAMDFQKGSNVLVTAAGESTRNLGQIQSGLLKISSETGTSTEQMTEGMYTVEKAGYRGGKGLDIMRSAAMGARDEGADLGVVTNGLTSIMQASNGKLTDSKKAMNALMVAAGSSKTSLQDFTQSLSQVLPVSSKVGIGFDQVAGAIGTMTSTGMSAQQAAQNLNHTISSLAAPTRVQATEMQAFGLSAQDVRDNLGKRGLQGTIEMLSNAVKNKLGPAQAEAARTITSMPAKYQDLWASLENGTTTLSSFEQKIGKAKDLTQAQKDQIIKAVPASQGYAEAMKKMTGGIVGLNVSMMTTGKSADGFRKRTEEVGHAMRSTDDFQKKWGMTQKTASASMAIAKQTIHNVGVELAMNLMPAISKVATGFTWIVSGTMRIARANWGWMKWVAAGIGAVVLALTAMRMGMAIGGTVQALAGAFGLYTAATSEGAVAQWGLNAAMDANPIGLIVVAVVAMGAALVLAYKKVGWFRDLVNGAFHAVGAVGSWLWNNALKPAIDGIGAGFSWLWKNAIKPAADAIAGVGKAIWDHGLKPMFSGISTALGFVGKHWKVFATIIAVPLTPIIMPAVAAFKLFQNYGGTAMRAVGAVASWLWKNVLGPVMSGIGTALQTAGKWGMWLWNNAFGPAFRAIGALASWLWTNALKPALSGIWTGVQTLAHWVQWLWTNGFSVAFKAIGTIVQWLWHYVIGPFVVFGMTMFAILGKAVWMLWTAYFKGAFTAIAAIASWLWHNVLSPVFSWIWAGLKTVGHWASWLWSNAIAPAFRGIAAIASWMWHNIVSPVFNFFMAGLRTVGKWAAWLWHNGVEPAFRGLGMLIKWVWDHVVHPVFNFFMAGLKEVARWANWLWKNGIKPAWDGLSNTIRTVYNSVIKPVFKAFGDAIGHNDNQGLRGAFHTAVSSIGKAWDKIKSVVAKPVNAVIGFIDDPFIKTFNSIGSTFGVAKIPTIPKIPGYAAGGEIPGTYLHDRADNVLGVTDAGVPIARVNPGEFITRNQSVRSMERNHPGALDYINQTGTLPRYADGGMAAFSHLPGYFPGGGLWNAAKKAVSGAAHAVTHPVETAKRVAGEAKDVAEGTLSGDAMKLARTVKFALQQVHKRYVWGAAGPNAFDCSGLTHAAYASGAGMNIPHLADTQAHMGRPVNRGNLQPGDLLFPYGGNPIPHVGIAVTPDLMVEAANPTKGVIGPHAIPALPGGARRLLGNVSATEVAGIVKSLGAIQAVADAAGGAMQFINPFDVLKNVLDAPINGLMHTFPKSPIAKIGGGAAKKLVNSAVDWGGKKFGSWVGVGGGEDDNVQASGDNAQIVKAHAEKYGWGEGAQWNALQTLVQHESGFRNTVKNPSSTAYGMFQFLDSTWNSVHPGAHQTSDPNLQSQYGMEYIKKTYGSPMAAWQKWMSRSPHWYGQGTTSARPGVSVVGDAPHSVADDAVELVFGRQFRQMKGGEQVFNMPQLGKLARNRRRDTDDGGVQLTFNHVPLDAATEISNEIGFNLRRMDYAGRYERV